MKVVKVMNESNRFVYKVKNLSCSNCALKIEQKISELDNVQEVYLDLINNKLTISTTLDNKDILRKVNKIASSIEPGTKINEEIDSDEGNSKLKLIRLLSGFILFLIAYINLFANVTLYLYIISYLLVGTTVIFKAIRNIFKGNFFDENFLMMIATFAAFYIKSYEEAVVVMLFYEIGEYLQDVALNNSRRSIKKLIDIKPRYANRKVGDLLNTVEPETVKVNDIIVVKPGEQIPLDGIIISGNSDVDTSQLTGEALPKSVTVNDEVLAGFINYHGLLEIKVTKPYEDTQVNKILALVEEAQSKKAPVERFITRFAKYYTPVVIFLAVLIVILPMFFMDNYQFNDYLYRGAIFLIVACPCALVISIPLSMFGGIGRASKEGILVKGGNYLDLINKVGIIVFDKTGTLTKGNFVVTNVYAYDFELDELIEKTILVESFSNHAIGKAIVNYRNIKLVKERVTDYQEIFGKGIKARVDNEEIIIGNERLMKENEIDIPIIDVSGTIVYVAIKKKYRGYFIIEDEIKKEAKESIVDLKNNGISQTIILSGDNEKVTEEVRKKLNIDKAYANLLPEDKLNILQEIKQKYPQSLVMFVGDGVNDTLVITSADIGVAMGGLGSDAAIEASDCVIMNDDISKLVSLTKISRKTKMKIWQNIILALGVKFIVLALGAFGLSTMWMAIFSDVGVALLAVLNSIMILKLGLSPK